MYWQRRDFGLRRSIWVDWGLEEEINKVGKRLTYECKLI
jgi:hypothetical protein